jgi:hypothetical protein
MISDFLGSIGGLEFVSADEAFTDAVDAQRRGTFGQPEGTEIIGGSLSAPNDAPSAADTTPAAPTAPTDG